MSEQMTVDAMLADNRLPRAGWLAGYPRSGAALVRNILARCFGHVTLSRYPERFDNPAHAEAVNDLPFIGDGVTLGEIGNMAAKQGAMFFKTHELPDKTWDRPTIVIVRDPRRVFGSLRAWNIGMLQSDWPMRDLILGRHRWGNWSAWIRAWAGACAPDTLWLRYGDLCADPIKNGAERISACFGFPIIGTGVDDFNRLRAADPVLFRARDVSSNGGLTPEEERLCWELHGATASMLGYYRGGTE